MEDTYSRLIKLLDDNKAIDYFKTAKPRLETISKSQEPAKPVSSEKKMPFGY